VRKNRVMFLLYVYAFSQVDITIYLICLISIRLFTFAVYSYPNNFALGNCSLESTPAEFNQLDVNKMIWGFSTPILEEGVKLG